MRQTVVKYNDKNFQITTNLIYCPPKSNNSIALTLLCSHRIIIVAIVFQHGTKFESNFVSNF